MNYSDNRFSFSMAEAVVLERMLGELRIGQVSYGDLPSVTLRQEGEVTYLDFVLATPQLAGARYVMSEGSTAPTLTENCFYVFPTMSRLQISLSPPRDASRSNEYRFRFTSGDTPTVLSLPSGTVGAFTPQANTTYEVSICDGYLTYQAWEV